MNQAEWNKRAISLQGTFLQSWEWAEFQASYGRAIERIWTADAMASLITYKLPLGRSYVFSPWGPLVDTTIEHPELQPLIDGVKDFAAKQRAIFWRFEGNANFTDVSNTVRAVEHIHPEYTRIITLQEPEALVASFKPKWRYNVRLAEKKGVTVRVSQDPADNAMVYALLQSTAKQQGITIHPERYYKQMMESLTDASYYIAEYNGKAIAANIMIGFGETMTYLHGGTDHAHRALMAPHILQYQAMCDAYAAGYTRYDLFGVAAPDAPDNHAWQGISRFKAGFGGEVVHVGGTYEMPLQSMWYTAYRLAKRFI